MFITKWIQEHYHLIWYGGDWIDYFPETLSTSRRRKHYLLPLAIITIFWSQALYILTECRVNWKCFSREPTLIFHRWYPKSLWIYTDSIMFLVLMNMTLHYSGLLVRPRIHHSIEMKTSKQRIEETNIGWNYVYSQQLLKMSKPYYLIIRQMNFWVAILVTLFYNSHHKLDSPMDGFVRIFMSLMFQCYSIQCQVLFVLFQVLASKYYCFKQKYLLTFIVKFSADNNNKVNLKSKKGTKVCRKLKFIEDFYMELNRQMVHLNNFWSYQISTFFLNYTTLWAYFMMAMITSNSVINLFFFTYWMLYIIVFLTHVSRESNLIVLNDSRIRALLYRIYRRYERPFRAQNVLCEQGKLCGFRLINERVIDRALAWQLFIATAIYFMLIYKQDRNS